MMIGATSKWSQIDAASRGLVCGRALLQSSGGRNGIPATGVIRQSGLIRKDWGYEGLRDLVGFVPWRKTFKIEVRARESGETLWVRPFASEQDVLSAWAQLLGIRAEPGRQVQLPTSYIYGELSYYIFTVITYNASNVDSTHDWANGGNKVPLGVTKTDYLNIAGGAPGGGANQGGGGGAGGYLTSTNFAVTPGNSTTITVGLGATGLSTSTLASNGGNSIFASTTTTIGGGAGAIDDGVSGPGVSGGSGGGGNGGGFGGAPGTGTGGQGNSGGAGVGGFAGGGGGSGSAPSGSFGQDGGSGLASSITGSSVTRAGGGGGGIQGGTPGLAGSGGATAGSSNSNSGDAIANTGSGTGGTGTPGNKAGNSAAGVIIISFTPAALAKILIFGQSVPRASTW